MTAMALSPIRDRLMRGYACTRTLDRQADGLRSSMADLASNVSAAATVLATIEAIRATLARAELTAMVLKAELDAEARSGAPALSLRGGRPGARDLDEYPR